MIVGSFGKCTTTDSVAPQVKTHSGCGLRQRKRSIAIVSSVNPLITNDAYMRQIIACAEVPMTHICVKDEGAHFHGIFGCCERATALSSSQPIQ